MINYQTLLTELNSIKSFRGKIEYANKNLDRIGGGSGRIVYLISDDRVLKVAKNAKGIAQNRVEVDLGYDNYIKYIITNIYDNADDNSWILVERAKKVSEKRLKELTEIPNISELSKFLKNEWDNNRGRGEFFHQDQEVVDFLWENEFTLGLVDLMNNYDISAGDLGRVSTYGEVNRNGESSIVVVDYGLNDEVYNTHYNRNKKYKLYELHLAGVSYGDHLADIGNVSQEVRNGMWALVPDGVGDGDMIDEECVNFVLNRESYPKQTINGLSELVEVFHDNLNNLELILKTVSNPIQYYKNLITLQKYLVSHGCYDRQLLVVNDSPNLTNDIINEGVDSNLIHLVAVKFVRLRKYSRLSYLGMGSYGRAYDIGDGLVLKVTSDHTEANEVNDLIDKPLKYIAQPYEVAKVNNTNLFVIILEKLKPDRHEYSRHINLMDEYFTENIGLDFVNVMASYMHYGWDSKIQTNKFSEFLKNNPKTAVFLKGMLKIADEINQYGINSFDFLSPDNLGYKDDGTLAFFDVGVGDILKPTSSNIKSLDIIENQGGGGAKFTTSDNISNDGFPTYNNIDTSTSIQNNLDANSAMYNENKNVNQNSDDFSTIIRSNKFRIK